MSIQITEGKFYKARNGEKYGPMRYDHATDTDYVWDSPENSSGWCADGRFVNVEGESDMDLIAEWVEPCALGSHYRGDDNSCTICGATPEQVNEQAREAMLPSERLDAAEALTTTRHSTHGDWTAQSATASSLKGNLRGSPGWPMLTASQREALDMIAVKLSRILCGDASHADHWDDIAGYAYLAKNGHKGD